ncbi:TetR/AcrR family transcriptional regulator [Altererythrobacter sp. JGD-16]|uniref:TetR/AcrR family transcriptional regulator n=1 Tax=Altererythrobacter lutimaris TaxID=2743979 RepID=A0A850H8W2_9SPHN|nr:TetR/AcrR family transcriptional regulator [Altererythrobacter lutimaris]NVE95744.1 TetR/AcrR family transcriptional regulator [Altererythrobacter lutimaris]
MSTGGGSTGSNVAEKKSHKPSRKGRGRPVDAAKRKSIVEAAAQAFFDVGYAASSIEQIAADAGVSKVTVYNHFGDKRALFTAAVERECEKMRGYFSIEAFPPDAPIRKRLLAIGEAMMRFLSRPEMVQFERRIAAETVDEPEIGQAFLAAGPWRMKESFGGFLAMASERGELSITDPRLAAEQFVSMCKGMGDLERRFGATPSDADDRRRLEGAVDVFLKAHSAN